jgi:hypothetical protein
VRQPADLWPQMPDGSECRPLEGLLQDEVDPSVRLMRTQPLLTFVSVNNHRAGVLCGAGLIPRCELLGVDRVGKAELFSGEGCKGQEIRTQLFGAGAATLRTWLATDQDGGGSHSPCLTRVLGSRSRRQL